MSKHFFKDASNYINFSDYVKNKSFKGLLEENQISGLDFDESGKLATLQTIFLRLRNIPDLLPLQHICSHHCCYTGCPNKHGN